MKCLLSWTKQKEQFNNKVDKKTGKHLTAFCAFDVLCKRNFNEENKN